MLRPYFAPFAFFAANLRFWIFLLCDLCALCGENFFFGWVLPR